MRRTLLWLLFLIPTTVSAQDNEQPWQLWLEELATDGSEDNEGQEQTAWDDAYDLLCELQSQPLDINHATREDLEQLPFLTAQQVEDILYYIYRYGPMRSVSELQMISSLDRRRRQLLQCFVRCVPASNATPPAPSLKQLLSEGRHDLTATLRIPLYRRRGDRNGYKGYPYKHWLRYQFKSGERLRFGLVGAQDAGEPFFGHPNRTGYDFYSFYLQTGRWGRLSQLTIGRFRLATGLGLVANGNFSMGKTMMLSSMGRHSVSVVRPHSSRSPANYLQGIAATVDVLPHLSLTAFASMRYLDATLNADGTAATIVTDGYHRTLTEINKKNNTRRTDAGAHMAWRQGAWKVGATALWSAFNRSLVPNTNQRYRQYYPAGKQFFNASIDYGYTAHRFSMRGETALNRSGALATIHTATVRLGSQLNLSAIHRFYSYRYTALLANSFSDGGHTQNESGLFIAAEWRPMPSLQLQAYTDFAYHPWLRYQVNGSSQATDHLVAAYFQPHRQWTFTARYRLHRQQKNEASKQSLIYQQDHRLRLGAAYDQNQWNAALQLHGALSDYQQRHWGWLIMARGGYRWRWLTLNATISHFRTTAYVSRINIYEPSLRYGMSFPALYGHGIHSTLMVRSSLPGRLELTARASLTNYFDRSTIGSSYQTINGSSMTDVELQAHWRF